MSNESAAIERKVLERYCKYIVHMRQQLYSQPSHFGLVLGAGVCTDLGFPDWRDLVKRIAETEELRGLGFVLNEKKDPITNAQQLFQTYKTHLIKTSDSNDRRYNRIEMKARSGWQRIVHEALYRNLSADIKVLAPKSYYLWSFINIIKELPMVVNYNFDDTIQRMLAASRTDEEKAIMRGYTTVWSENVFMYPKKRVVYHPNGFLPHNFSEHPSEQLVFLEDSFADQLIESINGRYSVLSNYFTHNTCLLIGLSLSDPTLRHILRNNALNYPGIYHYYIRFVREDSDVPNEAAITDANFDVYNLITLFLKREEISALGRLLSMDEESFNGVVEELGLQKSYKYIIVGSVAVGKSTAMSHFRSISTQDEWLEPMPSNMTKDPSRVDCSEIDTIDEWIAEQWGKKNYKLLNIKSGIHLIDRGPLDAFAFTPKGEWHAKAELTKSKISPGYSNRKLCSAQMILLLGDAETMAARALSTHRETDAEKLRKQQDLLEYIYTSRENGTNILDTRNKSKYQVAKEVARMIFLENYEEAPLNDWLEDIMNGTFPEPDILTREREEKCIVSTLCESVPAAT